MNICWIASTANLNLDCQRNTLPNVCGRGLFSVALCHVLYIQCLSAALRTLGSVKPYQKGSACMFCERFLPFSFLKLSLDLHIALQAAKKDLIKWPLDQMNDPQSFSFFYRNICWLFSEEALETSLLRLQWYFEVILFKENLIISVQWLKSLFDVCFDMIICSALGLWVYLFYSPFYWDVSAFAKAVFVICQYNILLLACMLKNMHV